MGHVTCWGKGGRWEEVRTVLLSQRNLKERDHFEDLDVDGSPALNLVLNLQHVEGLDWIYLA